VCIRASLRIRGCDITASPSQDGAMIRIRLTFFKLFTGFSFNEQDGCALYVCLDSIVTWYLAWSHYILSSYCAPQ